MTRQRMFGSDIPFLAWVRAQRQELPSISGICGIAVTDVDCFIHRYMTAVDQQGTREIQAMMQLEIKTRGGDLTASQRDTYWKIHNCSIQKNLVLDGQTIRHFGVSCVFLSGETPDDSRTMEWGRYIGLTRNIRRSQISVEMLFKLLRFDVNPDTFHPRWWRRHHATREIVSVQQSPLGFVFEKPIIHRS